MAWTRFYDMSSGGSEKMNASTIWIEASESDAAELFQGIFGLDPDNVTCPCCGPDYWYYESDMDADAGDWIVSAADILRFRAGAALAFDSDAAMGEARKGGA